MPVNYYFSGTGISKKEDTKEMAGLIPYRLLSCHGAYTSYGHTWARNVIEHEHSKEFNTLLLDSGAFTAWNQGHEMLLKDLMPVYYDFMMKYWTSVKEIYLINLDKIPGSPGRTADEAEIKECIEVSDRNYELLVKEFGPRVMPVYHQGESEARLKECVKMSDYICVSPRNDLHESQRVKWSREVHSKLERSTKTHGLAATGLEMMTTVPWTSVDSATWIFKAGNGTITLCVNGKMVDIGISEKSPTRHFAGQHINTVHPMMKKVLQDRIEELGYSIENLMTDHNYRMTITMKEVQHWVDNYYYLNFNESNTLFEL